MDELILNAVKALSPITEPIAKATSLKPEMVAYIFGFIILGIVLTLVFTTIPEIFAKKKLKKYMEENPTAVRVKLNRTRILFGIIASSTVYVQKVDDAHPVFGKANRSDIILLPGTHKLEINYSSQRIGVFYKTVAQYTEFENIEVTVEEGNEYIIKYDKKEGTYKIDKVEPKKK